MGRLARRSLTIGNITPYKTLVNFLAVLDQNVCSDTKGITIWCTEMVSNSGHYEDRGYTLGMNFAISYGNTIKATNRYRKPSPKLPSCIKFGCC